MPLAGCFDMGVIYKITNPQGKVYIGQTVNFRRRMTAYRNNKKINQPRLSNSIFKYGWEAHRVEIIHEGRTEELNDLERYYQDLYQVMDRDKGLNLRLTGTNDRNGSLSDETKKKISERDMSYLIGNKFRKGIPHTEEDKRKISQGVKGLFAGEKNPMYGMTGEKNHFFKRKHTEEARRKMSESLAGKMAGYKNPMYRVRLLGDENHFYGKKHTDESREKMRENHRLSKKVVCTETGREWNSICHCAEDLEISRSHLANKLKGKVRNNTSLRLK